MFKHLVSILVNIGIIFSFLFSLGDDKIHGKETFLPKLGLIISSLGLVYHIVSLFNHSDEKKHDDNLLQKLF